MGVQLGLVLVLIILWMLFLSLNTGQIDRMASAIGDKFCQAKLGPCRPECKTSWCKNMRGD